MTRFAIAAVLAVLAACPARAATETIEIHGVVPVICRADFQSSPSMVANGLMELGTIDEFCNAGSGYQIVVDYDGSSDAGSLIVDGQAIALNASGHTIITSMSGPRIVTQSLAYEPGSHPISAVHIQILTSLI
jgi:hypothetical protein